MRGLRPVKPTALRIVEGNPGKRRINKREPQPVAEPPAMPDYVSCDEMAARTWRHYMPILQRMKVITEADGLVLASLCIIHSFLLLNLEKVRQLNSASGSGIAGMVVPTKTGYLAVNQLFSNVRDAMKQELRFCQELGLSPSSRTRLEAAPDGNADDPWEQLANS